MKEPVVVDITFVGPERSLNKFQPVNVATGTLSSGIRIPARSLPSASAWGMKAGKAEPGGGNAAGPCWAPANRYPRTFGGSERSSLPSIVVWKGEATRPQYSYDEFVYMIFGQNCSFIRWVSNPSRRPVSESTCGVSLNGKMLTG